MSIELQPLDVSCHMACGYCYQEPIRDGSNTGGTKYDIDLMIERGLSLGGPLTVFGGEALLVPKEDLEKVFRASFEARGSASVQTNGDLIDDDHIQLFKKYRVGVGVSIDGPGELNSLRVRRSSGESNEATNLTLANLVKLREAGISTSVIITLHRENASDERIATLMDFGLWLLRIGIPYVNVHPLESESWLLKEKYGLKPAEERRAMLALAGWIEEHPELRWDPFRTMKELLNGASEKANCVWHHCDPLTTAAVQAVRGDGSMTNCGRTAKEGVPWLKSDQPGYERYLSLYQTPKDLGGCKGCRFFLMCGGECPGTGWGADGPDWRLKTDHCQSFIDLFEFYERIHLDNETIPLSLSPKRKALEAALMKMFAAGRRPHSLQDLEKTGCGGCGKQEQAEEPHGDSPHGDTPHGDSHEDHTDALAIAAEKEVPSWTGKQ